MKNKRVDEEHAADSTVVLAVEENDTVLAIGRVNSVIM